jgi:peptidoglycan/LPS O-acetylase OafA/YrhL
MAVYLLVGSGIARFSSFYSSETKPAPSSRFEALDGLRGLLAFGVFFHHARFTYEYYSSGWWEAPEGGLYLVLGPLSVALFFTITAFLFWAKARAADGRVNPLRLWLNRVRRIAPMYLVSLAVIAFILLILARFRLPDHFGRVASAGARMLFLGFFGLPQEHINQVPVNMVNAGVYWTLRYEWMFYLALPILAFLLRWPRAFIGFVVAFAVGSFLKPSLPVARLGPFVVGMTAAQLISWRPCWPFLASRYVAVMSLLSLCLVPITMGYYGADVRQPAWKPITTLCTGLPFIAVVYGNDFFGLLRFRGAKVLGLISYSVYLLHGIVLFVTMWAVHHWHPINTLSPVEYWAIASACGFLTLLLSALTYRYVEYPWLKPQRKPDPAMALQGQSAVDTGISVVR